MKKFAIRLLLAGILALIALYPLYLVAGNLYLRSGDLHSRLNRRPERLLIETSAAWTLWPGTIHVRDFRIRNQTSTTQWWASMDSGTFHIRLFELRNRELIIEGLNGRGVSYRLRRRVDVPRWGRKPRPELQPAIPGLENPPLRPPEKIYPPARKPNGPARDPWRIRLAQVDLDDVREIWIDEIRFAGAARIASGFDMKVWRRLLVDPTRIQITSGTLALGKGANSQPILADATGRIDGEISPYSPREHRGWNSLRFVSGRAEIRGEMHSLDFLEGFLRKTGWLDLEIANGRIAADLRLRRGRILPGSRMEAKPERLAASTLDYRAEGPGQVVWEVVSEGEGEKKATGARILLSFDEFQVARKGYRTAHVRGRNLAIRVVSGEPTLMKLDLFSPRRFDLELPHAEVPDFSFYNAYLPRNSGLALTGGSGRMSANFRASAPDWTGTGDMSLDARGVSARFEGRPLRGNIAMRTLLRKADFRGKSFDVSGSKLDLTGVRFAGTSGPASDWWARAHLDHAVIEPGAPVFLRARVESTISDPRPLMAFMAPERRNRLLNWVDKLLDVKGIGAVADLTVGDGAVTLDRMAIEGGPAKIQGRLRFGGAPRQGILYASYGRWDVGIELDGDQRDWKVLRPKKWFANQMGDGGRTTGR